MVIERMGGRITVGGVGMKIACREKKKKEKGDLGPQLEPKHSLEVIIPEQDRE